MKIDGQRSAVDRILELRTAGDVIAAAVDGCFVRPEQAAAAFGLSTRPETYRQVAPSEAVAVLASAIFRDMAYEIELAPIETARQLASTFVFGFPPSGTRFFTNGTWRARSDGWSTLASWSPATKATFDAGVLVLSAHSASCLWFMDED